MTCTDWTAFHQDYVTGVLSDAARAAMDRHLSDCAACFGEVRLLKLIETKLRGQKDVDVPAGLVDRVMAKTHPPVEIRGRFGREFLRIAAAAVFVAGLGFAGWKYAPVERAKPITESSKSFFDVARAQIESLLR